MIKNDKSRRSNARKIIIIITSILIVVIVWLLLSGFIFDKVDENKFSGLDTRMENIYNELEKNSYDNDEWAYKTACNANRTGWLKTGDYNCVISISIQKKVSSASEFNNLFTNYFDIIDKNSNLKNNSDLIVNGPADFGKSFVVSSALKNYTETKSGVACEYLIKLHQDNKTTDSSNDSYGSPITEESGNAFISFKCSSMARNAWFPLSDTADLVIP